MLRKRFLSDLEAISKGVDPKAVIRDPETNQCISLPIAERKLLTEGLTREELANHPIHGRQFTEGYPFQQGQPKEVRDAFLAAMGVGPAPK
jgi:5,5'-dehydrodivanillate O-demethylase